jgi:ankyrin repeat protein
MFELISLGAYINAKSEYNKTPLIYALEFCKDSEVIYKLIELGADINAYGGSFNETTFMYALRYCKDSEVIKKLIDLGADTSNLNNIEKQKLNEILSQSD